MAGMERLYTRILEAHFRENRQMAFLSGPRQVGKTTIAKSLANPDGYLNWDRQEDRRVFIQGPRAVAERAGVLTLSEKPTLLAFDEIHKYGKWKNFLKGFFDGYGDACRLLVTGSARLNIYKRGGDSLMGRYFPFRMHPLSLAELATAAIPEQPIRNPVEPGTDALSTLIRFGGFPEPFLKSSERFHRRWLALRTESLFKEDIRDATRIQEAGQLEIFAEMLAAQSGQLVNYSTLARHVNISVDTARRWLATLEAFYHCFTIRPWFRNVAKSLRKQPKVYMWDWSALPPGGARFENLMAAHLLKAIHAWTDLGMGKYDLHYLRDVVKREVDFLVTKDRAPWFLVEVKTSSREINPNLDYFQRQLNVPHAFQVSFDLDFVNRDCFEVRTPIRVPASTLLSQLC